MNSNLAENNDLLLTSKQLEHRLDVTPMTIWNWRRDDQVQPPIPTVIIPGLRQGIRFPYTQVAKWLMEYKPTIAYKLLEDNCICRHCSKMRVLTESVAQHIEQVQQIQQTA